MKETFTTGSVDETLTLARQFALTLRPGTVVALSGELGAGKTVFARGVCEALGADGEVTSPTFTLIHEHPGPLTVYHMDFYRLERLDEILDIGAEDYLYSEGVCLVEWAENMGDHFPDNAILVRIERNSGDSRVITIVKPEVP
jgi:tRNA threonylcarbamoyladenosine biosynthesis protein TsaE